MQDTPALAVTSCDLVAAAASSERIADAAHSAVWQGLVHQAGEEFAVVLQGMPLGVLLEVVEATTELTHRSRVMSIDREAENRARHELAFRARVARADLVELLADALDAGAAALPTLEAIARRPHVNEFGSAVAAFAIAVRVWVSMPEAFRDFLRAWNGVDVAGFDPWKTDIEACEFTEAARRLRAEDLAAHVADGAPDH